MNAQKGLTLLECAAALAVTAQGAARAPGDLLVSSQLERIRPIAAGEAEDATQDPTDASASQADELIVSVRFANSSDRVLEIPSLAELVVPGVLIEGAKPAVVRGADEDKSSGGHQRAADVRSPCWGQAVLQQFVDDPESGAPPERARVEIDCGQRDGHSG